MAEPNKEQKPTKTPLLLSPPPLWARFLARRLGTNRLYLAWRQRRHPLILASIATAAILLLGFFVIGFFIPSRLEFSFAGKTCAFNPTLLPNLINQQPSEVYTPSTEPDFSLFGYPILSLQTCVHAQDTPVPNNRQNVYLAPFGNPIFKKRLTISTPDLPHTDAAFDPNKSYSAKGSLSFSISTPDKLFSYVLVANDKLSVCDSAELDLTCPISPLEPNQGQTYQASLKRYFGPSSQTELMQFELSILDPVVIENSSINEGATVYDNPNSLTLTTNKPLTSVGIIQLINADSGEPISSTSSSVKDNILEIKFAYTLPRKTPLLLKIDQLTATDGSELEDIYELRFTTSGGPKVDSVSIGNRRVATNPRINLGFDIGLKSDQNPSALIKLEQSGKSIASKLSISGDTISIRPSVTLQRCTDYTIKVEAGLINQYDIGDGEAWQHSFRTICHTTFSIGQSVQGRSITAYRFGDGTSKIVFVGGMHGNERSSVATMNALIDYLENRAHEIPAHRQIIIIPNHNPDAYAKNSRTNANNVDLNRNFPTPDWKPEVQIPGGTTLPHGGGHNPLDQPETAALANYIQAQRPRLVLTYHAVARVVISNDASDSISLGQAYGRRSGYRFATNAAIDAGGTFDYATTGEFEDWVATLGIPALLVELATMSRNELSTHQNAIWDLIKLP